MARANIFGLMANLSHSWHGKYITFDILTLNCIITPFDSLEIKKKVCQNIMQNGAFSFRANVSFSIIFSNVFLPFLNFIFSYVI